MNNTELGILSLIKSAVAGEKISVSEDFDWKSAAEISVKHHIAVLVYYGAYNSGIKIPEPYSAVLNKHVLNSVQFEEKQKREAEMVYKAFNDGETEFLPLKGAITKKYYPQPEMRYMCDVDMLIKQEQYPKIKEIMEGLGFEFVVESNHEYVWKRKYLNLELHKYLIPSYNKDYYDYYGTGWKRAQKKSHSEYELGREDFLIYIFTHLAKHYRDSGVGIKHFADIWVYKRAEKNLDEEYINSELAKLQLAEFYKNSMKLLDVWFEGRKSDDMTDFMTKWIFSSGAYGTPENNNLSAALKETKVFKDSGHRQAGLYIRKIFLPLEKMKGRYTVLKKAPYLLPVMWIVRLLDLVLFKRKNISESNKRLRELTDENINNYEKALNYVGLDFNFKE